MKIKKYVGSTNYEAMMKLKSELGGDAVILSTRELKPRGLMRFFKPSQVEITAAYEEKDIKNNQQNFQDNYRLSQLSNEIRDLKDVITRMDKKHEKISNEYLNKYRTQMLKNGVEEKIVDEIVYAINAELKNIVSENETFIRNQIVSALSKEIGEISPINISGKGNIVLFFGSTGVGKTTTLAKLAAKLVLDEHYDIGIITSDTYRIAAVEQLRTYSDILKLPLIVAYDAKEIQRAVQTFKDKDIIFIDTAGRSYKDEEQAEELAKIFESLPQKESYLVLNATFSSKSLKTLLERYHFLEEYKLLITKLDESEGLGNIINLCRISGKPLSYFTDGQNVPDDIMLASSEVVIDYILQEFENE